MARDDDRNTAIAMPATALSPKPRIAPADVFASAEKSSGASRRMVWKTALGGGSRNDLIQPARTSPSRAMVTTRNGITGITLRVPLPRCPLLFHRAHQGVHLTRELSAQAQFVGAYLRQRQTA